MNIYLYMIYSRFLKKRIFHPILFKKILNMYPCQDIHTNVVHENLQWCINSIAICYIQLYSAVSCCVISFSSLCYICIWILLTINAITNIHYIFTYLIGNFNQLLSQRRKEKKERENQFYMKIFWIKNWKRLNPFFYNMSYGGLLGFITCLTYKIVFCLFCFTYTLLLFCIGPIFS